MTATATTAGARRILALRPYQRAAIDAIVHAGRVRGLDRPAVVLPTGAGKTVVFAHFALEWLERHPGKRVLILVHTAELLAQTLAALHDVAPWLLVGAVQASRNETLARVVVGSVQTLRNEQRRRMLRDVGLIIVDECHHAVAVTYRTILNHFGALEFGPTRGEGDAVAVGFTATMTRADDLALGDVWQDVVYVRTISDMIHDGYLIRPHGIHVRVDDLDLSQVKTSRGDYASGELGKAIEESLAPEAIAKAVAEHAPHRKILLFAPTVSSAQIIADALSASGRRVGLIHGGLTDAARTAVVDAFRADPEGILANCMVLTEGFDEPSADCVVIARPTKSRGLYIQIVGRILRPFPGKTDALVLDVVGASKAHGLLAGIDLFGDAQEPPTEKDQTDESEMTDGEELIGGVEPELSDDLIFGGVDGPLVSTEVDLFASSVMSWLRTRAGVFYLAAGERYIAVLPTPAGYEVVAMHQTQRHTGALIAGGVADLAYAMAWAEGEVTPSEKMTASKERRWRAQKPSEKTIRYARALGITIPEGARAGEMSNMISIAKASQRIDAGLTR